MMKSDDSDIFVSLVDGSLRMHSYLIQLAVPVMRFLFPPCLFHKKRERKPIMIRLESTLSALCGGFFVIILLHTMNAIKGCVAMHIIGTFE